MAKDDESSCSFNEFVEDYDDGPCDGDLDYGVVGKGLRIHHPQCLVKGIHNLAPDLQTTAHAMLMSGMTSVS